MGLITNNERLQSGIDVDSTKRQQLTRIANEAY